MVCIKGGVLRSLVFASAARVKARCRPVSFRSGQGWAAISFRRGVPYYAGEVPVLLTCLAAVTLIARRARDMNTLTAISLRQRCRRTSAAFSLPPCARRSRDLSDLDCISSPSSRIVDAIRPMASPARPGLWRAGASCMRIWMRKWCRPAP